MTQQEIGEGNPIIAKFMDLEMFENGRWFPKYQAYYNNNKLVGADVFYDKLEYHSSWDWLMPVVDKVRNNNCFFHIYFQRQLNITVCEIHNFIFSKNIFDIKNTFDIKKTGVGIEPVFEATIEFIKWYNQQQNEILPTS